MESRLVELDINDDFLIYFLVEDMHDFSHCYSEVVAPVVACTFAGETG